MTRLLMLLLVCIGWVPCASAQVPLSALSTGDLAPLNGWVPSPNDAWHQNIANAAVDPNSANFMSLAQDIGLRYLHPDFGSTASNAGIPYTVVDSTVTPLVRILSTDETDSDDTLYPIPATVPIEGNPGQCWTDGNDHHAILLDRATGVDYEIYQANLCNGVWTSYGNVIWDFTIPGGEQRPYGLSSVDAAGLSVFEGLIRYDEIVAGSINHAIRFTISRTKDDAVNGYFTAPATHAAGNLWGTDNVMGMRIRLKASFDISGFSTTNQIILKAMQQYGMILADNGSDMFFQGTTDPRWNDADLGALKSVPSTAFDVVQLGPVYDSNTAPKGALPVINSFTASADNVAPGTPVTLTPNVTGASYNFVIGGAFTRGGPITVSPTQTTTYTLISRGQFGSVGQPVTVNVTGSTGSGGGATTPPPPPPATTSGPTGTVSFYNGTALLGTSALDSSGHATLTFGPPAGGYSLTAVYSGDATDATSTSVPVSLTVAVPIANTTTTLTVAPASVDAGQAVSLTAQVANH